MNPLNLRNYLRVINQRVSSFCSDQKSTTVDHYRPQCSIGCNIWFSNGSLKMFTPAEIWKVFSSETKNHLSGKYADLYKEWLLQSFPLSIWIACKAKKKIPKANTWIHYIKKLIHRSILWLNVIYSIVCHYVQWKYKLIIPQINNFRDTLIHMELVIFSFLCIIL